MLTKIFLAMAVSIPVNAQHGGKKVGPAYIVSKASGSQSVLSVFERNENDIFHYQLYLNDIKTTQLIKSRMSLFQKNKLNRNKSLAGLELCCG